LCCGQRWQVRGAAAAVKAGRRASKGTAGEVVLLLLLLLCRCCCVLLLLALAPARERCSAGAALV
jgi:hypothetical protein